MTEERKAPEELAPPAEPRDDVAAPEAPAEPREGAVASPEATIEQLRAEVERYREEADHHWQQFLHAAADLENYKKQAARQREEAVQRVRAALLGVVLDVLDTLERAIAHGSADPGALLDGLRLTHRKVSERLQVMGVQPMEARGKPFDPRFHEAIDVGSARELGTEPDTVVEELQRGYLLNGEVLRPARVRVAR